ncbi:probable protein DETOXIFICATION 45, chloroplastic at C-terminar half [Coccomyxa sp. Obi]|nr:probable protein DETOXIFICATION 45, chloroplastic at C-terminar half [Coccomyxa sp. Obi]
MADVDFGTICGITIPAIVLNVAAPLVVTVQTALLGTYGGSPVQAAFAAVSTTANTTCFLFNFLVDGVSAKVGQSVGSGNFSVLQSRVHLALLCALGAGLVAFTVLAGLQRPITAFLNLSPEVQQEAAAYWWLRAGLAPIALLNMSLSGILQGYNRVAVNAALNTGQSLLEIAGSWVVLAAMPAAPQGRLAAVGAVSVACASLAAIIGGICAATLAPKPPQSALDESLLEASSVQVEGPTQAERVPLVQEISEGAGDLVDEEGQNAAALHLSHFWDFVTAGFNMLVRSATLQATFFLALSVAGRLGTAALAAHQVVAQLWLLTSYVVDGFAVAATVLGSRLAAKADPVAHRKFQILTLRLVGMGLAVGLASGAAIWANEDSIISLFTADPETAAILRGRLWFFLCLAQPINAGVFVYDGLMYATQSFACARTVMLSGFVFAFAPLLALTQWRLHALWGVWGAKAAHNVWRLVGSVLRVHVLFEWELAALEGS